MADFDDIIQEININLPDNNTQAITAKKLRDTIVDLTDAIETQQSNFEDGIQTQQTDFETNITNRQRNFENDVEEQISSIHTQFATGQNIGDVGIDDEPTAGSENLVKSEGIKAALFKKKINDPYFNNDLIYKNYNNIIYGKYISVENSTIVENTNPIVSYIKIPIPVGYKSLFIQTDENFSNVNPTIVFVDSNNTYLSKGYWKSDNILTNCIMPENIPDNAAYVYINFKTSNNANFKVFVGIPLILTNKDIIKADISEVCDVELFDKLSHCSFIKGYISGGKWTQPTSASSRILRVSTPITCYEGDVFEISGWCLSGVGSGYSWNIAYFDTYGECVGVTLVSDDSYTFTIPQNIGFVSFMFNINYIDNFSIKRIRSGRITQPVEPVEFNEGYSTISSIAIKGKKYNILDKDADKKLNSTDKNLLKGSVFVPNYYINTDGQETYNDLTAYTHISVVGGKYLYIIGVAENWSNLSNIVVFTDGTSVLGYSSNINSGIQPTIYNQYQCISVPTGTTDVYINIANGQENNIKLYVDSEIFVPAEIDLFSRYTDNNLIESYPCKLYWNKTSGYAYNNSIRSSYPIKVLPGEKYKYSNWTTQELGPTSINTVYTLLDENWNYISYGVSTTDPVTIVIPNDSSARWMILNRIINTSPSLIKTHLGVGEERFISDAVEISSEWKDKIWVGLGDSLTRQSSTYAGLSWSPAVEEATGLIFKNCGIGGTCLAGNSSNAFWTRLSAVEAYNPDLVTILGGANDLYDDIPIGDETEFEKTIALKDCTNFIGAYSYIIETLLTWKKTLRIVILTTAYAHSDGADHTPGIGLTYGDYAQACRKVAHYYGLPIVDLYYNMGLNKITQDTTYTRGDNIHWNARASQIVASLVSSKLKEINNAN